MRRIIYSLIITILAVGAWICAGRCVAESTPADQPAAATEVIGEPTKESSPAAEVDVEKPLGETVPAAPNVVEKPSEPAAPAAEIDVEKPSEPAVPAAEIDVEKSSGEAVPAAPEPASADPAAKPEPGEPKRLRFNFRYQPWADVLDWFAEQAGYSLILDSPPTGTFNYRDERTYTPAEAIDLLNSVLLTKGYTLVLRDRMLMLVNLADGVPASLVTQVPLEELDKRGSYELISTRFQLLNIDAEEARREVEKLLGPQGKIVVLPQAKQLMITETGGRLREIRDVLQRAEQARDPAEHELRWFDLSTIGPTEALALLRQMFDIKEGSNATADGTLRFAADPGGLRLLVAGRPDRLRQVAKTLEMLGQPAFGEPQEAGPQAAPQLEVYDLAPADPDSVLRVMQTLLAEFPGVRLAIDPKTGKLIALARPTEQATVRATVEQMRRDAQTVEVIPLRTVEPQMAVLAINRLFSDKDDKAPSVDADLANRQLLIRGSGLQIAQIRQLLEKLGETAGSSRSWSGGKLRLLPIADAETRQMIERLKVLWPALGENELRVALPPDQQRGSSGNPSARRGLIDERTPMPGSPRGGEPAEETERGLTRPPPVNSTRANERTPSPVRFAVLQGGSEDAAVDQGAPPPAKASQRPPIFIFSGPEGLYISSDDLEALDRLEALFDSLQGRSSSGQPKLTVFYLRNAQATAVAERLNQIFALSSPIAFQGPPGTRQPGAPAAPAAQPDTSGLSTALSAISRLTPVGPISITPDDRLNALLVQAAPADVDMIEEILTILDRREGPEDVPVQPKPRMIPVLHTSASEIAQVIKDVYQDRMTGGGAVTPQQIMQQMFARRPGGMMMPGMNARGGAAGASSNQDAAPKMSIGVDTRTNSLVVAAPEKLFEEVRNLVGLLDQAASEEDEMVEVVTLRQSNPAAVSSALSALLGDAVQTTTGSPADAGRAARGTTSRTTDWRARTTRQQTTQPRSRQTQPAAPTRTRTPTQQSGRRR